MRYHLTTVGMAIIKRQEITSVGQDVEKIDPLCTAGGNINWCRHCGEQYGASSKELKIELPHDPAIQLLGTYPKEMKSVS